MRHELSEAEKSWRSRPFHHTGRVMGGAAVACVVVPYYLWQLGPGAILGFVPYLLAAGGVGLLVVLVRRILRPPRRNLDRTFVEVTTGGIWRVTPKSRSLLIAAPQIQSLRVRRSNFNEIVRIDILAGRAGATITGLKDMQAFLGDVLSTYERCTAIEETGSEYA